jgi:hypothetical protein
MITLPAAAYASEERQVAELGPSEVSDGDVRQIAGHKSQKTLLW